jgi:uncharacterized damage-inducible protein DinB
MKSEIMLQKIVIRHNSRIQLFLKRKNIKSMLPEYWLRGPLPEIDSLLQPVAHALLQAEAEINNALKDFEKSKLWDKPGGVASVGFHLQHIAGVQDRLFTYAKGELLNDAQMEYLRREGIPDDAITVENLLQHLRLQTERSMQQIKNTSEKSLAEVRYVGRKKIASTVMGILFHAAEHTMRHTGQLLVTVKISAPFQEEDNLQ